MKKLVPADQVALPGDLKRVNRQRILNILRTGRVLTAADIHEETGISRPTVMRALQDFCALGAVRSLGLGETTRMGGKKPELFILSDEQRILCINLWPETITLALCGMTGDVQHAQSYPQPMAGDLNAALKPLRDKVTAYLAQHSLTADALYGMVLTVPGTVDYEQNLLRYNVKAPGWGADVPLIPRLRELFGQNLHYCIDNAGKAAGRALLLEKPEYADKRLMTFFTTWGVSACMIERGHVLNGRDSLIGEIGHMIVASDGPVVCGCGKRGCLESLVSASHMRRLMNDESLTFPELFARSDAGDEKAREVVAHFAHCFAVALHNLSLCYNQESVVFQGDFAHADPWFDRCLTQELRQFRYYPDGEFFTIEYDARDLSHLAAQGAAELLRKQYFTGLE